MGKFFSFTGERIVLFQAKCFTTIISPISLNIPRSFYLTKDSIKIQIYINHSDVSIK